jgi:hypothetical protein
MLMMLGDRTNGEVVGSSSVVGGERRLVLGVVRLRNDPEFEWVSGGSPNARGTEGNGQPPGHGRWGLWYSATRPRPIDPVELAADQPLSGRRK